MLSNYKNNKLKIMLFNKNNKNNKNIGFICTSIDNMAGGLERQIIRTCESFIKQGFSVFLFTFDNNDAIAFYTIPDKIIWIKCGHGLKPHTFAPLHLRLKQIYYLRRKIQENSISTLITFHHGLFPRTLLASIFLKIKLIISERNSLSFYKYIKLSKYNIGFLSLFFADAITVQVPSYKNQYPYFLKRKIFIINNFIKEPLKKYIKPNLPSNNVCMIGRLCAQKNYEIILDQIYKKSNYDIQLFIAGDGDLTNFIKDKYQRLIKSSKLTLCGNIKDIDSLLSNSAIYCMTSQWEGYPNSLVEALRMCLPIVISKRFEELTDFVEHEVNGLIVNDNDYLEAIIYLLNNKKLLLKMSKQSYKKYCDLSKSNPSSDWYNLVNINY